MAPPAVLLLGSALAGASLGVSTYGALMVPDLVLRQRKAGRRLSLSPLDRAARLLWGEGHLARWRALGIEPLVMYRLIAMFALVPAALLAVAGLWPLAPFAGLATAVVLPRMVSRTVLGVRRQRIVGELPDVLGPVIEGMRVQPSPIDAVRSGLPYADEGGPLREELERVLAQTAAERDFPKALSSFAERVGHPLARDLARALTVGFEQRLDPRALEAVMRRLRGLRTELQEYAVKSTPNVMVAAVSCMFVAFLCLGAVALYGMFQGQTVFLP